jgi:cupin fold WbuC family metalloprotein
METIEFIKTDDRTVAVIIRSDYEPDQTTFITPDSFEQQVGFVVYPAEGHIPPHRHKVIDRHIKNTSEALVIRKGLTEVLLYDDEGVLIAERILKEGDILVLVSGGHAFRMIQDTIMLEIKQGPYTGLAEKEHF